MAGGRVTAEPPRGLPPGAVRRTLPAAALIWLERAFAAEAGWVLSAWLVILGASLAGLPTLLAPWLRLSLIGLAIVASVAALVRAAVRLPIPQRSDILLRLDADSSMPQGTMALLGAAKPRDLPELGEAFWRRAQQEARRSPPRLSLHRPALPPMLKLTLAVAAFVLLAGLAAGNRDARDNLAASLSPWPTPIAAFSFQLTVSPPDYAPGRSERRTLDGGSVTKVQVLAGGHIDLVSSSPAAQGWRLVGPDGRSVDQSFIPKMPGRYRAEQRGRALVQLDIALAADGVPLVAFDGAPQQSASGALSFGYRLTDDYGLSQLAIAVSGGRSEAALYPLADAVPPGSARAYADLTADPRAGGAARLTLVATDGAGNVARSQPIQVTLPEKTFTDPVAKEVIAVRRELLSGGARRTAVRALSRIAGARDRYDGRLSIFAGLRTSAWRLIHDDRASAIPEVADILWDIATDLEDGGASRALDDLRASIDELMKAAGSDDDQLMAALTRQLQSAMEEYLRRQLEAALANGEMPDMSAMQGLAPGMDASFLDGMMADLRDRLAAGDREGAMEALQNLRGLMEQLQFGPTAPDPEAAARAQKAAELLERLGDAESRQEELRDRTITESILQAVSPDAETNAALGAAQRELQLEVDAIRKELEALGAPPSDALGKAAGEMRRAGRELGRGDPGEAARAESEALRQLAAARSELEGQMQQMQQQAAGGMVQPGQQGSGVDPLGRPGRGFGMGKVDLPDAARIRRIQEIRRLLEERAADPNRSEAERSYYLRLLKRF